jgi:glycosyltransferase involved in cell wall biosynthesis
MAFRPYYLAKEWSKLGHKASIIGADHSHLRTVQPKIDKDLFQENIDGIPYIWIKTPVYDSSGMRRILNILTFVFKLLMFYKKISNSVKPDVVIASSTYPLDIYPAYLITKHNRAKLIFELHDMWPLSPMIIGGYSKYHPFIWIMQKAENFACRKSNGYVSMLGNAEEYLVEHGLQRGKFTHIANGFFEDDWINGIEKIPSEHTDLLFQLKKDYKLIVGYTGGHAPSNALDVLIDTAEEISDYKVAFVLVGNGVSKNELIRRAKDLTLKNIYFLPPVNKLSIPKLLIHFDILFAGGISSSLHQYGTSFNKLTDYMLAGKPIIFAVDEPNSLVEKVGCGIQIPAENKQELIRTILFFSKLSEEQRIAMGSKGREYALKELNYKSLAKKFMHAIEIF